MGSAFCWQLCLPSQVASVRKYWFIGVCCMCGSTLATAHARRWLARPPGGGNSWEFACILTERSTLLSVGFSNLSRAVAFAQHTTKYIRFVTRSFFSFSGRIRNYYRRVEGDPPLEWSIQTIGTFNRVRRHYC